MTIEPLVAIDLSALSEPDPGLDQRELYEGWLRYQRHEFVQKLRDLSRDQLAAWSVPPLELSVLGLVRDMTRIEHDYVTWGLGGGEQHLQHGDDDTGGSAATGDADLRWYFEEVDRSNAAVSRDVVA